MSSSDTWDLMRARTNDLIDDNGTPETTIDGLLGGLGVVGKTYAEQVKAVQGWLDSPAAQPADKVLLKRARRFVSVGA